MWLAKLRTDTPMLARVSRPATKSSRDEAKSEPLDGDVRLAR
jgi:hypothetical protein